MGGKAGKAGQTEVTLKQTYLSALPVDSLLRIEHQRALAFLCGGGLRVVCGTGGLRIGWFAGQTEQPPLPGDGPILKWSRLEWLWLQNENERDG